MKLPRRQFLHLAAGAAALPAVSRVARAQAYPSRPVRLIVPFGSAGATDITARLVGQWLSERLGQQFIIENRTGAGGNIGTEAVARAAPDGYTLLMAGKFNVWNPVLYDKLSFNFMSDIAPVASIIRFPNIMVVNPSVPAKTLPEFIAYAKSRTAMKIPRRGFLHLAAGAAALTAIWRIARAQTYPTRPVRLIVGFTPGGGTDTVARLMGQWLSERLAQPFLIENRTGAGSNIAAEAVVNAPPDWYTLLVDGTTNAVNTTLYDKLNFIFHRDITPVAGIMSAPMTIDVNPWVPVKTVPEFIAYAQANPGRLTRGSGGIGTSQHVAGELLCAVSLLSS
jgi:tripartite-type tricarboxylate transporter receptor subunit TctC